MPAVNPRITITLQPAVHAVLRRLSELTGNSQSSLVGELLGQSLPIFERMVEVLSAAEELRQKGLQASKEVGVGLEQAQARLEEQLGLELDTFRELTQPLLDDAERVQRRAGRGVRGAAAPTPARAPAARKTPMSNRGVTPHGKAGAKGKVRGRGHGSV